jgi:L-iditol 2-dehydrogenase
VRVAAVGICGSDLHSYSEGAVGDTPCIYPMVLGHEPSGVVTKTGAGVTGWSPGDRAALEPALFCYHCEFCLSGHHNVCANLRFMSNPGEPGFFREYANLPARNLLALPAGLSLEHATLVEPLAVALHSMQFVALRPGETAAVFGVGPIGLLTIIALKLAGAGRVWAIDPVAHRLELARAIGADAVIDPRAVDPVRQLLADTGNRGVDVAIDCAGKDNSVNQSIHAVRNAGRVVVTAIPPGVLVPIEFSPLRRKEIALYNVRRSNHESDEALATLAEHTARFARILTHSRPLDEINRAFAQLENYEDDAGKIVIAFPK